MGSKKREEEKGQKLNPNNTEVKSVPSLSLHPCELLTQKHGGWRLESNLAGLPVWYP